MELTLKMSFKGLNGLSDKNKKNKNGCNQPF